MSYSFSVPPGPKHDVVERLAAACHAEQSRLAAPSDELEHHFVAAAAAVPAMVAQVGRPEDHVIVRLSGHVNPMHAPGDGYGDEYCQVQVAVVAPDVPPEP